MDAAGRYRLTLALPDQLAMSGWWGSEETARRQFTTWVGERGSMPGVNIELVDTADDRVIHRWPDETGPLPS